jgi:hypothetical protein
MERRQVTHHLLVFGHALGVDGLSMLAQVIEPGELLAAVAGKRTLSGMLPDVPVEVRTVELSAISSVGG